MTRYVIDPHVALHLARENVAVANEHQLLAPTLLRSQLLSVLYKAVRHGEMSKADAERHLDYVRGLRIRLLGDRVLQAVAWKVADHLGWPDTFAAEYVALTQLQADSFITVDPVLTEAIKERRSSAAPPWAMFRALVTLEAGALATATPEPDLVTVAPVEALA